MTQTSYMKQGDLIVRKVVDRGGGKECLVSYVSTPGTSPYIYCSNVKAGFPPPGDASNTFAPPPVKK
jgi:hypothetical protein